MTTATENLTQSIVRLFTEQLHVEVSSPELDLIDAGLLDSLMLVELVMNIERDFGAAVSMEELDPDNFRTVDRIVEWIRRQPGAADVSTH